METKSCNQALDAVADLLAETMRELDTMVLIAAGNDSLPFRVFNEIHFGRDPEIAAICLIMVFLIALPLVLYALLFPRRLDAFDA